MNSFPEDDKPLIEFLKRNQPSIPAASPDLEDRILAVVEVTPQTDLTQERPVKTVPLRRRRSTWLLPSAIAAGLVATVIGYRSLLPPQPSEAQVAELESFIENTWTDTLTEQPADPPDELFPLTDNPSVN